MIGCLLIPSLLPADGVEEDGSELPNPSLCRPRPMDSPRRHGKGKAMVGLHLCRSISFLRKLVIRPHGPCVVHA
jgi:hypothetical protein